MKTISVFLGMYVGLFAIFATLMSFGGKPEFTIPLAFDTTTCESAYDYVNGSTEVRVKRTYAEEIPCAKFTETWSLTCNKNYLCVTHLGVFSVVYVDGECENGIPTLDCCVGVNYQIWIRKAQDLCTQFCWELRPYQCCQSYKANGVSDECVVGLGQSSKNFSPGDSGIVTVSQTLPCNFQDQDGCIVRVKCLSGNYYGVEYVGGGTTFIACGGCGEDIPNRDHTEDQ